VYLVGGSSTPQNIAVSLDGKPIQQTGYAGADVKDSQLLFGENKLYRLVSFPKFMSGHTVQLSVPNGAELNTFTFGS